jgi:exonuclease SbcC
MKVLEIGGCNLASLKGEFRIALDQAPFSRDGLFAIRGVTGSGKSTLIDAICLALYNQTPRFMGQGGAEIGLAEQKDRLKATDPRSILHRGMAQGWAEVIFRGVDGSRWRARWSVARARKKADGKFQSQEMELENLDTGERPSGTRTEVLEHIQNKVGLTFEQFKRSVLLAQGEFAAFVKANEEARANLLEAMTGTDIYARISMAAQKRSALEDQNLKDLQTQRDLLGMLSEEARGEQEIQMGNLGQQIKQQEKEQAELQRNLGWHERSALLERQCTEAAEKAGLAGVTFEQAATRRIQFQLVEGAQALRPLHANLARTREHHDSLDRQIRDCQVALPDAEQSSADLGQAFQEKQDALAKAVEAIASAKPDLDTARALDTKLQEALVQSQQLVEEAKKLGEAALAAEQAKDASQREEERLSGELALVEKELKVSSSVKALAQSWPRIEKDIEGFAKTREALRKANTALVTVRDTATEQGRTRASLQKELEERISVVSSQQVALDTLTQRMAEEPRETLDATRKANQTSLDQVHGAEGILLRLHPLLSQLKAAEDETRAQASAKNQANIDLDKARRDLPALEGGLNEAKAALERAQAALSLEDRRHQLVDGEPCPLCGSAEHPWAQGSPLARLLEAQTRQVAKLDRRRNEVEQALTRAQTQMTEAGKAEIKALKEGKAYAASVQKEESAWKEARTRLPELPEDGRSPQALTQVRDRILDLDERLADIGKREVALLELEKQAEQLRRKGGEAEKQRRVLDGKIRLVDEALQRLSVLEAEHARDITNWESALRGHRETLATVLDPNVMAELDHDPASLRVRLTASVAKRQAAEAAQIELTRQMAEIAKNLEGQRATASEKRATATTGRAKRDETLTTVGRLQDQRKGIFEGRSVAELEKGLEAHRKASDVSMEEARKALQAADKTLDELKHTIATLQEQWNKAETAMKSATSAFLEAVAQRWEGDLEALEACLGWTPEAIQAERNALQSLETECSKTKAVLDEYQKALGEHLDSERPTQTQEELKTLSGSLKAALDDLKGALGGLQADLMRDDQARRNAEALTLAIRDQQDRTRLWNEMNTLVGSSDGKKFRTFAQSLTLEALLVFANDQLSRLTPRYRLQRVPGCELEIQVIDQDMGDEIRPINSLSGGETFLVSLALALGLSSLSASDTPIDSLFIDEGFGTLDSETLETALSVLDELQSQGRQIGIISHVDGLATHIPVQITVGKLGGGRSKVVLPLVGRAG